MRKKAVECYYMAVQAVLVPDGLTFRKGGRMNCGHTAYGMVQSDKVPGWSELLLEHAYSDSQDYCLLDMDCSQLQTIRRNKRSLDSSLYETGSVGDDTNNNKGGNAPIAISSSCGSEVDLDSGAAEPAVAAGVFSDVEPTSLQIFNCIYVNGNVMVRTTGSLSYTKSVKQGTCRQINGTRLLESLEV
ncbi:hypothetical protein Tco_0812157 [Tanacetum coccineum]